MTTTTGENLSLTVSRTLKASRDAVFRAWTNPTALKQWLLPAPDFRLPVAEVDLRVGGSYRFEMVAPDGEQFIGFGTYQEIEPPAKLVFTWNWETSTVEPDETLITVELRDVGGATELLLTHSRLSSQLSQERHGHGWAGCLDSLQAYIEGV